MRCTLTRDRRWWPHFSHGIVHVAVVTVLRHVVGRLRDVTVDVHVVVIVSSTTGSPSEIERRDGILMTSILAFTEAPYGFSPTATFRTRGKVTFGNPQFVGCVATTLTARG